MADVERSGCGVCGSAAPVKPVRLNLSIPAIMRLFGFNLEEQSGDIAAQAIMYLAKACGAPGAGNYTFGWWVERDWPVSPDLARDVFALLGDARACAIKGEASLVALARSGGLDADPATKLAALGAACKRHVSGSLTLLIALAKTHYLLTERLQGIVQAEETFLSQSPNQAAAERLFRESFKLLAESGLLAGYVDPSEAKPVHTGKFEAAVNEVAKRREKKT